MEFIIKILTHSLTVEFGKRLLISLLKKYAARPDNKVSDDIVESVIEALENNQDYTMGTVASVDVSALSGAFISHTVTAQAFCAPVFILSNRLFCTKRKI